MLIEWPTACSIFIVTSVAVILVAYFSLMPFVL